jgi:hypothetical protein
MLSDLKGLAIRAASFVILAEREVNLPGVNVGIGRVFMETGGLKQACTLTK